VLALVEENYDYRWQTAGKEFRRAIELNPNDATAHEWYGEYLSWMGRFDEALAQSDLARQLDPLSLIVASDRGWVLYRARQYDRAIAQGRAVLDMDPSFSLSAAMLIWSYVQQQRFPEALDVVNRYIRPISESWAQGLLAAIYGKWGHTTEAEQAFLKFKAMDPAPSPTQRAVLIGALMGMGRNDDAIATLQEAFSKRHPIITAMKVDPLFDPLRRDSRFQSLLRRAALE
jgi:serine/threonine-protein kinase